MRNYNKSIQECQTASLLLVLLLRRALKAPGRLIRQEKEIQGSKSGRKKQTALHTNYGTPITQYNGESFKILGNKKNPQNSAAFLPANIEQSVMEFTEQLHP